ncbi:MAG: DUF2155 domain-containing protein [Alphaproteobacteria bacterium]
MKKLLLLALLFSGFVFVASSYAAYEAHYSYVKLRALDKVTARITDLKVPLGGNVSFGTMDITARTCKKRPPEEPPESAAFLEIKDRKTVDTVFSGWMFASSPALSALEHPVYDVWVLDCL